MSFDQFQRADDFDQFQRADQGPPLKTTLKVAAQTKPDTAAEVERLAKRYPAPPEVIERNIDTFQMDDGVNALEEQLRATRVLQRRMGEDVRLARLAQDDVPTLAKMEQFARDLGGAAKAGVFRASRGAAGTFQAGLEFLAPALDAFEPDDPLNPAPGMRTIAPLPGGNPLRRLAEGFAMAGAGAGETAEASAPKADGVLMGGFFSGVQSLTQNMLALPMAFLPGGQGAAMAMMVSSTGGDAYQQAREKGLPMSQALPFAASQGAIEYATEKLPLGALLKDVKAGTPFFETLLRQVALEIPGEQVATVLQDLNEWAVLNPEKPFSSYLEERPNAAAQTLVATVVGTGGNVAVAKGIEAVVERAARDGVNMQRAGVMQQALEQALKTAESSLLRERSPEQFRALMTEMAEDGAVYVDAEVLNQMPADLLQQMQGVAEELPAALETGGSVAVKLADILTLAPGTPAADLFLQNARSAPDAPSAREAEQAGAKAKEFLQAEMERVIAQATDQEAMRASGEAVRASIAAEITATGRYRPVVAEGMAQWASAFYTTMAGRTGMTPEQFYQRYRLRVLGAPSTAGQVLNDGQRPGAIEVDAYHFSTAARPQLSTAFYGTGLRGSARDEIMSYPDERVRKRLSFYVDKGTGIRPEAGVGGVAHRVKLSNIYDANADPLKLRGGSAREFETKVLDAGFTGYLDRLGGEQPGQVVVLGDQAFTPEVLGPVSRIEAGERVPALPTAAPEWKTQASGAPEAMQARLERMQASGAWKDYDLRVEGGELQSRAKVFEQSRVKDMTPAARKLLKNLTPIEQRKVTDTTAAKIIAQLKKLPPAKEMAAVAFGGKAKRGWYKQSAEAISAVFQQDGPRFAALLAATSPQCSVETNLLNALNVWKNWVAAGRPTDREAIIDVMGASVQGGRGRGSVLDAWINNSVRALTADNPADAKTTRVFLSGPKVNSFFLNLIGVTDEVTNDAWMANYALVDQVMFSGSMNVLKTDPGKGSGYLAMAARTREAAAYLTKVTGETWTPAEVQETVWSWAKTLYEMQVGDMTATRALNEGLLTDDLINSTPDFSSLFNDPVYGAILKDAGYGDRLDTLGSGSERTADAIADEGSAAGAEADAFAAEDRRRLQLQTARRLERLREQRAAGLLEQAGDLSGQPQPTGNGAGRYSSGSLAPLEGAPTVAGASGPDPRLVAVAEQYAADNGIALRRQAEFVEVDPARAARIAAAYEAMAHAPNDPAVAEAYQNLAQQTLAQYRALEAAGYQFYLVDETNDPYGGNPWNAMRDLRANQSMGVFATEAGFGTSEFDPAGNPLLADTGLEWGYGAPDGPKKRVLFNDLFRAVHDAFGHGLEGAGFRARGEENAWQAHVRLFTGSAVGAITSETRGQNSWLNYGPHGQANQTAKVEDTVFADQKTGLMPEWTWTEGRAADEQQVLEQADMFPGEFATKRTTVETSLVVDSKGTRAKGGNTNSKGQQVTATKQGLQRFWNWFEGSEVTDDKGRPLVLYHSTNNDVTQFETNRETTNSYGILGEMTVRRAGIFLTPDIKFSQEYLRDGAGQNVMQVYAALKNPLDLRAGLTGRDEQVLEDAGISTSYVHNVQNYWELFDSADDGTNDFVDGLKAAGYDGAIFHEDSPGGESEGGATYVAFESSQVKSATGNRGTFDPADPSILSQGPRGTFSPKSLELVLNPNANLSTWFHETGHFFLEVMADIASQPNAPAQIVEDMNTFLKWAGVKDPATWNGMTLDQQRKYHERWAESIEQYVMEGKAPSVELQPLMRRFATWLKSVYGSIKQMLAGRPDAEQTPLNDDIRRVMDRMLATDEQIAQANEVAGLVPDVEADATAAERLNKRSMADLKWAVKARDQAIAKLRKQAATIEKGIREEVTVEVDQAPEMRAKRALDALRVSPEYAGMLAEHKAQRKAAESATREEVKAALLATNPDAKGLVKGQLLMKNKRDIDNKVDAAMIKWDQGNPVPKRPVNETDADVATIADSFGFESVDVMMQAIDAFGPRQEAIDGITERRMLEEHGDLVDERAITEAANEAVHNEARARSLASELRTQSEMLNTRADTGETNAKGSKITVNALVEAAKQFGASVAARTILRDLKVKAWQHTAAERRAGKRWQEATATGKTEEAVKAKQDQVLNHAAAKAAIDAQAEAKKILEFFRRVNKGNDETVVEKGRDADIVNAARAVLAAYGVQSPASKGAAEYLEALAKNDPETYNVVKPMVDGATANAQPLEALSFEQLQMLHEDIQAMWHLAKRSRQMEVDGDLIDVEDAAAEVYARLEEIGIPDTTPGEDGALTRGQIAARQWLQQVPALLRRVEQWAEGKDGAFGGPFLRFIFQPVKDAADRYRTDRLEYRRKFQALVDNVAPLMPAGTIAAPELGYTFGKGHNGVGHAELLHALLHTGNESNKRKLLLGRGWAADNGDGTLDTARWDAFIKRMADTGVLQPAHYDFLQGVWDLMEETKPLAQKTHRDVFGRYFSEVTADAFADPWGQSRSGGYVPAQADPLLVQDADLRELLETENAGMAQAFPQTSRGFTKARVEYNRPLKLDLRTLPQHIDKVLLFSHMEPAVRGVAKLLRQKNVSQPLARVDPAAMGGMLKPWLNRSARQTVETPISADAGLNRMASAIRGRVGMALMFANVSNTLQQFTGFINAATKVKPALMRRAAAQYIANPSKLKNSVWELSPYMADRATNEVAVLSDTLEEILIKPGLYTRAEQWTRRHGYFLQTALDNQMAPIIWTAAYNQALAEGVEDRMAIRYADGVIRQTQGTTLPEDVSRIETGPAYARLFTQFVGYFNMLANTNATALQQIAGEQGLKKGAGKAFGVLMLGLMVPLWVAEGIAHAMRGGPEDEDDDGYLDDWLAAVFGFGTIKGLLSGVPIIGQMGQSIVNRFNDQPADDKFSLSPTVSVLESAAGAPASVYKAIVDEGNQQKAIRDSAALITMLTGVPAFAVARPLGYGAGVAQGKIEPTGPVDAARGVITGTASPESKQR